MDGDSGHDDRSNFGWETHSSRRVGFWGDYLYVSAVPGGVNVAWTDSRDLVDGVDPREVGADDDQDGFDVYQPCTYVPNDIDAPSYSSPTIADPCLSQGGLDEHLRGSPQVGERGAHERLEGGHGRPLLVGELHGGRYGTRERRGKRSPREPSPALGHDQVRRTKSGLELAGCELDAALRSIKSTAQESVLT
jgi:hypothetical protein